MIVAKFGGSSVAGAEQFKMVRDIMLSNPDRRVAVISAAGKRSGDDHKLTDLLYLCHAHLNYGVSCDEIMDTIQGRLGEIKDALGLKTDVEGELKELRVKLNKDISSDYLVSRGEYFTAKLMAEYLGFDFLDAAECIFFGFDGQVDFQRSYDAIAAAAAGGRRLVIPGFYGKLPTGKIKVMSRGGSDISGALAAAALDAEVYENWTDVSGILMADPRIVDKPRPIERITYAELRELSFMGASVLHEESVQPVRERGIPLNIRNTKEPSHPGTLIVDSIDGEEAQQQERFITGIAGRRNFSVITLIKHNMDGSVTLRQALEILDRYRVPVEHITLGLDSFALVCSSAALGEGLYAVLGDMKKTCIPDDLQVQDSIALVAAVGRKMTFRPGVSGRLFKTLGEYGVNIRTIAQGADELSIIVGVDNGDFETAIRVLYESFAG